jgi:hypothetical protein
MTLTGASRITRNHDVQLTRTGDQAVLVDSTNGNVHVVNGTAARIWELCAVEPTFGGLLAAMSQEYRLPDDQLKDDVASMLETFCELQLIACSPAA